MNTDHPARREADHGKIALIRTLVRDWGWLIAMVMLGLGFGLITPGGEIKDVKVEQGVLKRELKDLTEVTRQQARDISTIVRLQCFNELYTPRQLKLVGIDCDGIR